MRTYKAVAKNNQGWTFTFTFQAYNWYDMQNVADQALQKIVNNDPLRLSNGPWVAHRIDIFS